MKRIMSRLALVAVVSIVAAGFAVSNNNVVNADPITTNQRITYVEHVSDSNTNTITTNFNEYFDPFGSDSDTTGYVIAHVSWTYPVGPAIYVTDSGPLVWASASTYTAFADDDGDGGTPEVEMVFKSETYVYNTNHFNDSITFTFDNAVKTVSVGWVYVSGVETLTPYASLVSNGSTISHTESSPSATSVPLLFTSVAHPASILEPNMSTQTEALDLGVYTSYPFVNHRIFTLTDSESAGAPELAVLDNLGDPVSADYSLLGFDVDFVVLGEATVSYTSATLSNYTLDIDAQVQSRGGAWRITNLSCAIYDESVTEITMGSCAEADDYSWDSAVEPFTILYDMTGNNAGNYTIELYIDEENTISYDSGFVGPLIIPFTMDSSGNGTVDIPASSGTLEVIVESGPTVVGDTMTISGYGTSQGGAFWVSQFEVYLNANHIGNYPAVDGAFDEATEEFYIERTGLAPGDYTLEIHVWETDGVTTNNTHVPGALVRNFTIEAPPPTAELLVTSGPTVVDRDMTISGYATARSIDWQITAFHYNVVGYDSGTIPALDGAFDGEQTEEFSLTLEDIPNDLYTIEIYAVENDYGVTNANTNTFSETFNVSYSPPTGDFSFTLDAPANVSGTSFITYSGTVTDLDGFNIAEIYYYDGDDQIQVPALDGTFDEPTEEFEYTIGPLTNGNWTMQIYAKNTLSTEGTDTFTPSPVVINNTGAMASCVLSNHPSPTSDNTPTHTVTCTSPDTIYSMEYKINNEVSGNLVDWTNIPQEELTNGTYNTTTSVTASITPGITLPDGNTSIMVNTYTGTGKRLGVVAKETFSFSTPLPIDVFVIEAVDDSAPTIKLNPILPNPVTSTSPYITGSCQDVHPFDTNSTIATLEYRIDGGAWTTLPPLNAPLDNAIEYFSYQLPEQAIGEYTLDVRCIDTAGNDTNSEGTNESLLFEIIAQPDVEPEEVIVTENFTTNDLNSVNETTAIWGNGYIRLKEKITFDKTLLDSDGFVDRYGSVYSADFPLTGNSNDVWYAVDYGVGDYGLRRYNKSTGNTTDYAGLSTTRILDVELLTSGGNEYVLFSAHEGLSIVDAGTGVKTEITLTHGIHSAREIYRDPRNSNFGFYVHNAFTDGVSDSNLYYVDLNGTPTNAGDDQLEWYATKPGFNFDNINQLLIDGNNNILYVSQYGLGLHTVSDQGTPLDISDDSISTYNFFYHEDIDRISGLAKDPLDDGIFILTHDSQSKLLYLDVNGTPGNPIDDELLELADSSDLRQQRIDNITFVEGPQYVGGQLFMITRTGRLVYYNTNGTYASTTDDTIILLETNEGLYPEYISDVHFSDYNTIYASFQHSGMTRIDLNRSWENTGDAVTISIPPEVRLIVNNINLEDVIVGPLLEDFDGTLEANTDEIGIQYFISIDDGVTYEELTVGELKTVLEEDYRLKLKITITKIGENSKTPIINGFTLAYGAYQVPVVAEDLESIDISTPVTTFNKNTNFTLTVRALDILGFPIAAISDSFQLQLKMFSDSSNVSYLTPISANFTNGVGTINTAQISQPGEYKITATYEDKTIDSVKLTVVEPPATPDPDPTPTGVTPTLNFYTDKATIEPGESTVLTWNTTNAASVVIAGYGSVALNGNLSVSPEETTTYYITVTDPDGDILTASLTIVVNTPTGTGSSAPISAPTEEDGVLPELKLEVKDDYIEVIRGDKVNIQWTTEGNPDSVYIDYLGRDATSSGNFEFVPDQDIVITITATRGDQVVTRTITIKVVDGVPNIYLPAIVAATGILTSSLITGSIAQYSSIFLGLVLFRKKRYWGIVYNASKSVPIPFVTVRVYKKLVNQKQFVAQTISDLNGRYGIPIGEAGTYQVEFIHEGYRTEIKDLLIQQNSDIILDVGMNEANTDNLPMVSKLKVFFKENLPTIMQWLRLGLILLMVAGAYITLQVIRLSPLPINYIVLGIYIVAIVTQAFVLLSPYINMKRGKVIELNTKRPVQGAVFRILGDNQRAIQGVESLSFTNEYGVVKIRVSPGSYAYQVSKPGYEANEGNMRIDDSGKITETIYLKKGSEQFGS